MSPAGGPAVRLVPVLDTDPAGYSAMIAGERAEDEITDPRAAGTCYADIRRSVEIFCEITDGRGIVTVHTSPFFRDTFLSAPYVDLWREASSRGVDLALHPHEDRRGGGTLYTDTAHLARVIPAAAQALRDGGLAVPAFRSGYCAFSNAVAPILERSGFAVDLSAAPGIYNPARGVDWRGGPDTTQLLDVVDYHAVPPRHPGRVVTVPIGWDGEGNDYTGHYFFNERNTAEDLGRVYRAIDARAQRRGTSQVVLYLCHTDGLCSDRWRSQAQSFLEGVQSQLIGVAGILEAASLTH